MKIKLKDLKFIDYELQSRAKLISARCGCIEIAQIHQQIYKDAGKEITRWYIRPTGILESAYDFDKRERIQFFETREFKTEQEAKIAVEVAFARFMTLFIE